MGLKHSVASCRQTMRRICNKRHHSLLHPKSSAPLVEIEQSEEYTQSLTSQTESDLKSVTCLANNQSQILLGTALIKVKGKYGLTSLRSLLDQVSQT